jgi:hypothetical protein
MSFRRALSVFIFMLSISAHAQSIELPKLTDAEKKKLDAEQCVVHELKPTDNRGVSAESMGVIDAPPDEVWPVVRDCEHFSKFLPSTKTSARKQESGESLCFDEISLPFPLMNLWADTKSVVLTGPEGHYQRSWSFVRGTYRHNRGAWTVAPWGPDGKKSLVVYLIDSDPTMLVPDAILRAAQTGSLPEVFTGIRKRVLALRSQRASTP